MAKTPNLPNSLSAAIRHFADPDVSHTFLVSLRWPHGAFCPACNAKNPMFLKTRRIYKCRDCGRQFSAKLGTIFEDSPLGLDKWLPAIWMLANSKNGISSYELGRALGVTQKTAWFMLSRLRLALQAESGGKLNREIEADETFIGGKARNMHAAKRKRLGISQSQSMIGKVAVMGLLQRHGEGSKVRTQVIANRKKNQLE